MKTLKTLLITLAVGLFIMHCSSNDPMTPPSDPPRSLSTLEKTLVASSNTFGFDLFSHMALSRGDANTFISPLSISMALGMAYNGAEGSTADAMRTVLGYRDMTTAEINATYKALIDLLTTLDSEVIMEIANSSWARQDFALLPAFSQALAEWFNAEARTLDFSDPASVDVINNYISEKTHGKIEDMLDEIDPSTVLFLINALYFKAAWTTEFDTEKTLDGSFILEDGSTAACKMMHLYDTFQWGANHEVNIIDLPYGDGHYSMTLVQPAEGRRLDELLNSFTAEQWNTWLALLNETEMDLYMPRFKVEDDWELKEVLSAMGMGVAFTGGADFSKINADRDIFISEVLHRTFVEVTEAGTEAAAVTVVDFRETSIKPMMNLNRPFLYVIRDHHSGTLMFMGTLYTPVENE